MISDLPPDELYQGDAREWTTALFANPASDGWALTTTFRAETGDPLVLRAAPNSDGTFLTAISSEQSAALVRGYNAWEMRVTKGAKVHTIARGRVNVLASLGTSAPAALETPAERYLAALEAIGPSIMANGYAEMELNGDRATFRNLDEYHRALKAARQAVIDQRRAGRRKKVNVRFTRPRI